MIRRAVERVYDVVSANFNADFALVKPATLEAILLNPGDFFKRVAAERFASLGPIGLGIYHDDGATQAKRDGRRDSVVRMVLDWWIMGDDEETVALQTEVAIEALLRSIDRLEDFDATSGVGGAGGAMGSVTWGVTRTAKTDESRIATERALIRFPILARETGL